MRTFLDYTLGLSHCQWYRRFMGGHWERCWVDPVGGFMWMQVNHTKAAGTAIRATHIEQLMKCEDY